MNFKNQITFWLCLTITVFTISGCATDIKPVPAPSPQTSMAIVGGAAGGVVLGPFIGGFSGPIGAVFGAVIGSVIGDRLSKQYTLVNELQKNGIRFFEVGDQITIVLPTDKFFQKNSSTVNTYSYALLKKVITLLNRYKKVSIKVAGYTDNQGSAERNKALSEQRAQTIAHYLWSQGIDTRLLYAVGYGASHFVANNQTAVGRAANQRIEITLDQVS